ncbi:hypothetical protein KJ673_02520 [Patescibacteria group bacterium]|nr:hypothetical protein [Patescibacteria group bacterium]MBU4453338.1 hypothetical protein [Patescibacteria group bacterium]MCG2687744.1 hypothetical protein [Candidatus Parcubacteria bacterium]
MPKEENISMFRNNYYPILFMRDTPMEHSDVYKLANRADFGEVIRRRVEKFGEENLKKAFWWNNGRPLMYKAKDPTLAEDLGPFFDKDGMLVDFQEVQQMRERKEAIYTWEPIYYGTQGLSAMLETERYEGVDIGELEKALLKEAESFEPGKCYIESDTSGLTREDRLMGSRKVGYGKTEDGKVWVEGPTFVDHSYTGLLRS